MSNFVESMNPMHVTILTWCVTVTVSVVCLALAIHHCGLRPKVRFSILGLLLAGGFAVVVALNPGTRGKPAQANVQGQSVGVTTETDLVAIQQVMETIGPEWVGGLLFHDDGRIEVVFTSVPVARSGSSKLYAVQFLDSIVKEGYIKKVVVFSGTSFQVPFGEKTQSVEVIASGEGDVLVATEDRLLFVDPQGDQSRHPIRVEQVLLAKI